MQIASGHDTEEVRDHLESKSEDFLFDEFLDGPMFLYNKDIGLKVTLALCQKAGEEEHTMSLDECPWKEQSYLWDIDDRKFTAGASRALSDFHELKFGEVYTLMASYVVNENGNYVAENPVPHVVEFQLSESGAISLAAFLGLSVIFAF